ncbi:MAG: 23S rRNA (guanosine(2251)-2'-O)-methyltransferase RlmB [Candidatus Omnitrophica bacterium]|nr:23S rRNA (guanosine(2251)-2'-O)-methyltransferase RlmB [Candidatus Omnitrophota bacterium]
MPKHKKEVIKLYGRNSVAQRLKENPGSVRRIFLQENLHLPQIEQLIKEHHVVVERVSLRELTRIKHSQDLQGIVARVDKFEYTPLDDLLKRSRGNQLTLVFLDRINDPQNLGVIMRTLACFGNFGLIIPKFEACEITETVLHVACGGENYVPVVMVTNLNNAIIKAKQCGYWILGTVVDEPAQGINKISLPFPLALVLGSEGKGIRDGIKKQLDIQARIPMPGAKLSLNVSIACAIFCQEITKQRGER